MATLQQVGTYQEAGSYVRVNSRRHRRVNRLAPALSKQLRLLLLVIENEIRAQGQEQ